MIEMEKLQMKGEVPEEELRAIEEDVTGRVCTTHSSKNCIKLSESLLS